MIHDIIFQKDVLQYQLVQRMFVDRVRNLWNVQDQEYAISMLDISHR